MLQVIQEADVMQSPEEPGLGWAAGSWLPDSEALVLI